MAIFGAPRHSEDHAANAVAAALEMQAAMKAVAAESIPERMEKGYDSEVGEGGDLLSTGEAPKIRVE